MMHALTRRALALCSALWLVVLIAEPAALHVCAIHSESMAHATGMSHHHAGSALPGPQKSGNQHSAQCTCLGASSHSLPIALPKTIEGTFDVWVVTTSTEIPVEAGAAPRAAPAFLHPYSNGPPGATAA